MGSIKEKRTKTMVQEVGSKNGVSFLNGNRGDASKELENQIFELAKSSDDDYSNIKQTSNQHRLPSEEAKFTAEILQSPPLGLKLRKTPSLVDLVAEKMGMCVVKSDKTDHNSNKVKGKSKIEDFVAQPPSEKLKASNFQALFLKIGTWERVSKNEGDLVAKCYYAKRKLVWEFLENGLKNKIEIQWADILAIRAVTKENVPGTLEIELSQPPSFFHELDPQPRKHTQWSISTDFTGGQAPIWRRHYVLFPPGLLDKHYEKLLQCDSKLFERSQMPFPSLESPYFEPFCITNSPYHFNGQMPEINPGFQFPHSQIFMPLIHQRAQLYEQAAQPSLSFKDSASPISDENLSNQVAENPLMQFRGQIAQVNSIALATQVNPSYSYQIHNLANFGGGNGNPHPSSQVVNPDYSYQTPEFTTFGGGYGNPHPSSQVVNPTYSCQTHEFTTFGGGNGSHNRSSQVPSDPASQFFSNTQVNPVNSYQTPDVTTFGGGSRSPNRSSQGQNDTDSQLLSDTQVEYSGHMKGLCQVDSLESLINHTKKSASYTDREHTNYEEKRAPAAADVNSASYTDREHMYYEELRALAAGDLVSNANEQIYEQPECMVPLQASNGNLSMQLPRIDSYYSFNVLDQSMGDFAADDTRQLGCQQMDMIWE